jgi:hypothetical protein
MHELLSDRRWWRGPEATWSSFFIDAAQIFVVEYI